jgi:leader peptidase (prepilin peptidase)/N-methyltransferase
MPPILLLFLAGALGAIVGSFLNVVIVRFPTGESIVFPPSHCPNCGTNIRPWDNIPIISYLLLGGRCRNCRQRIAPTYLLIETANALFYVAILERTGLSWSFLPLAAFVSMTLVLIFIDLDIQILPDVVDLPGIVVGLLIGLAGTGALHPDLMVAATLIESLLGAVLGAGLLIGVGLLYKAIRGVEGMGFGDVKMLAMLGAVVGWAPLLPLLFLASFTGAIFGIALMMKNREGMQYALPFGVFLGMAGLVVVFFGNTLLEWYRSLLVG